MRRTRCGRVCAPDLQRAGAARAVAARSARSAIVLSMFRCPALYQKATGRTFQKTDTTVTVPPDIFVASMFALLHRFADEPRSLDLIKAAAGISASAPEDDFYKTMGGLTHAAPAINALARRTACAHSRRQAGGDCSRNFRPRPCSTAPCLLCSCLAWRRVPHCAEPFPDTVRGRGCCRGKPVPEVGRLRRVRFTPQQAGHPPGSDSEDDVSWSRDCRVLRDEGLSDRRNRWPTGLQGSRRGRRRRGNFRFGTQGRAAAEAEADGGGPCILQRVLLRHP